MQHLGFVIESGFQSSLTPLVLLPVSHSFSLGLGQLIPHLLLSMVGAPGHQISNILGSLLQLNLYSFIQWALNRALGPLCRDSNSVLQCLAQLLTMTPQIFHASYFRCSTMWIVFTTVPSLEPAPWDLSWLLLDHSSIHVRVLTLWKHSSDVQCCTPIPTVAAPTWIPQCLDGCSVKWINPLFIFPVSLSFKS